MKINAHEALALAKVLHGHVGDDYHASSSDEDKSDFRLTLEELAERIDDYLVNGDADEDDEAEDCCEKVTYDDEEDEDEEAEDDDEEEEDPADEGDEEDDEDEGEGEEPSEEDDDEADEEDLECDDYVTPGQLHDLTAAKGKKGALEFEDTEEPDSVQLLLDGGIEHEEVTHLKRVSKELHVRTTDGAWIVYQVARFPKGWAAVLPLDSLVRVEA